MLHRPGPLQLVSSTRRFKNKFVTCWSTKVDLAAILVLKEASLLVRRPLLKCPVHSLVTRHSVLEEAVQLHQQWENYLTKALSTRANKPVQKAKVSLCLLRAVSILFIPTLVAISIAMVS